MKSLIACAAFAVLTPLAAPASAQTQVLSAPDEVRACVCMQQQLTSDESTLAAQKQSYDQRQREVAELDSQVATQRSQVNVNDPASVAAFKHLLDRHDAAQEDFAAKVVPQYQAVVARHNRLAATFNAQCGGKSYDATVLAQVQQALACPPAQ